MIVEVGALTDVFNIPVFQWYNGSEITIKLESQLKENLQYADQCSVVTWVYSPLPPMYMSNWEGPYTKTNDFVKSNSQGVAQLIINSKDKTSSQINKYHKVVYLQQLPSS